MKKSDEPKLKNTIKKDGIHPRDYLRFEHRLSSEDCSHYKWSDASCTIGYVTLWHRREIQQKDYELTGKMALCRFMEID